jgi:hypothetical protein
LTEKFIFQRDREQKHKKKGMGEKEYEERRGSSSPVGLPFHNYMQLFPQSAQFCYYMEEAGFSKILVSVYRIT